MRRRAPGIPAMYRPAPRGPSEEENQGDDKYYYNYDYDVAIRLPVLVLEAHVDQRVPRSSVPKVDCHTIGRI